MATQAKSADATKTPQSQGKAPDAMALSKPTGNTGANTSKPVSTPPASTGVNSTSQTSSGGGHYGAWHSKQTGPTLVFKHAKVRIFAGDRAARLKRPFDLYVTLDSSAPRKSGVAFHNGAHNAFRHFKPTGAIPQVDIDWPDYGIPALTLRHWVCLATDLMAYDGDILIHCMGGHGRTGTALAALAGVLPLIGLAAPRSELADRCVVNWVRKVYDADAVESEEQAEYLQELGCPVSREAFDSVSMALWRGVKDSSACAVTKRAKPEPMDDIPFGKLDAGKVDWAADADALHYTDEGQAFRIDCRGLPYDPQTGATLDWDGLPLSADEARELAEELFEVRG